MVTVTCGRRLPGQCPLLDDDHYHRVDSQSRVPATQLRGADGRENWSTAVARKPPLGSETTSSAARDQHPVTRAAARPRADPLSGHTHLQQVAAVNWFTRKVR